MRLLILATLFAMISTPSVAGTAYEVCRLDPEGDNFLALRDLPTTESHMVLRLGPGTIVESRGEVVEGKWMPVVVQNGDTNTLPYGYVYTSFICQL